MPRAGLDLASVTEAAACVADEVGFDRLSMGLVAERLGVRTPSLYKHVASQADLAHRVAVLGMNQFADAIRDATQGRAGKDALIAGAGAMRTFVGQHPGRYAAGNAARPMGPDDSLNLAVDRVLASWAAVLQGYPLRPTERIHALRMLRSVLHGFATLQAADGFQMQTDIEETFAWLTAFIDHGLRAHPPAAVARESQEKTRDRAADGESILQLAQSPATRTEGRTAD